jgi:hypothetical protein
LPSWNETILALDAWKRKTDLYPGEEVSIGIVEMTEAEFKESCQSQV